MGFRVGQAVALSNATVARMGFDKLHSNARGVVVEIFKGGRVASVDWGGTWVRAENGSSIRMLPIANLSPVLRSGVVVE